MTAIAVAADTPTGTAAPVKVLEYIDTAKLPAGSKPDGAVFTFMDAADPTVADLAQYGSRVIEDVGAKLITETTRELATKPTAEAVSILHLKNMELPKRVLNRPRVTAVKFTSLLLRNPKNQPDGADIAALDKIRAQLIAGNTPDRVIVQKIEVPNQPMELRVYRPIAASKSCLSCHGDPSTFGPGVKEALAKYYPDDKAVDYGAQEWRGVIRVSFDPQDTPSQK